MGITYSVSDTSGEGVILEVQVHFSNGLPTLQIIGTVGKSLDESKDRIRSAFSSSALEMPRKKITVNISPSDMPKDGSHVDLAISLAILQESKQINEIPEKIVCLGELGLDGRVLPIRGIIGKIIASKKLGFTHFIVPHANLEQAMLIPDIHIYPAKELRVLVKALQNGKIDYIQTNDAVLPHGEKIKPIVDFSDVIGQHVAKRALEIAATGHHNVLLSGPPGVGKSMLAKALLGILPPLEKEDIIALTHLYSLVGTDSSKLISTRPIRTPHHSSSDVSIIGGGQRPKPGEVSLSHKGILFLDELPEFRRATLESLRQPLEDKTVTVARAKDTVTYPADFILIATKNPCPCGFYGSSKPCVCSALEIDRYQKKLSGPLMDRIDIHVVVDSIDHTKLLQKNTDQETSQHVSERVLDGVKIQNERFKTPNKRNGSMTNREIKTHAKLSSEAKELLDMAADKLNFSARVYMKIVKIARTIADIAKSEEIQKEHVSEAIRYRPASNT